MAAPVFIVGYMGCGKTTAGKKLATKLGFQFLDTDTIIEGMTGKDIARLFAEDGEDSFRQLEHSVIVSLCGRKNIVVATGGGAPCYFDNMKRMNTSGTTVYIRMHPDSLARRISESHTERSFTLSGLKNEELPAYIANHLAQREPFYNQAHVIIKGENLKVDDLYQMINDLS